MLQSCINDMQQLLKVSGLSLEVHQGWCTSVVIPETFLFIKDTRLPRNEFKITMYINDIKSTFPEKFII